ncbi:hypothetical protein, partial [Escherichia coli]|uniref:hypothetical protein n=1 Tax=Escherichia coli TaxID=562 RepID=UPI001482251C
IIGGKRKITTVPAQQTFAAISARFPTTLLAYLPKGKPTTPPMRREADFSSSSFTFLGWNGFQNKARIFFIAKSCFIRNRFVRPRFSSAWPAKK